MAKSSEDYIQNVKGLYLEIVFRTSRVYILNTRDGHSSLMDCIQIFKEWYNQKVQDIVSETLTDCVRNLKRLIGNYTGTYKHCA